MKKVVESLNCVSLWNQNIRSELGNEDLVVEYKNLEIEVIHSCSDNILESGLIPTKMEGGSVPWICCSVLLGKLFNQCFSFLICKMVIKVVPNPLSY